MTIGQFIVFEGLDGAGTTTQAKALVDYLLGVGIKAVYTCEPSQGPIGSLIRNSLKKRIVSNEANGSLCPEIMALLFAADRVDHYKYEIKPLLDNGCWVVSDRYLDSSLAYQGMELNTSWLETINCFAPFANCTIFLNIDPHIAIARLNASRGSLDMFEEESTLKAIQANYNSLYAKPRPNLHILDGARSQEEIACDIRKIITSLK